MQSSDPASPRARTGALARVLSKVRGLKGRAGVDAVFLLTTAVRYAGPVALAILAVKVTGAETAKALLLVLSSTLLCATMGKFGADNQILKRLKDRDRAIGLRFTLLVWLPLSAVATSVLLHRLLPGEMEVIGVGHGTAILLYATLFLSGVVAALQKADSHIRTVQVYEFGFLQAILAVLFVVMALAPGEQPASVVGHALFIASAFYIAPLLQQIWAHRSTVGASEELGWGLLRERANCLVPNIITYVAGWGLLLPLHAIPPQDFTDINTAMRIATISTTVLSIANLVGIGRRDLTLEQSYRVSQRFGIALAAILLPILVPSYVLIDRFVTPLPEATDPIILAIYLIHLASVFFGPALFLANAQSRHGPINLSFAILLVIIGLGFALPVPAILSFVAVLLYTRIFSRFVLLVGSKGGEGVAGCRPGLSRSQPSVGV